MMMPVVASTMLACLAAAPGFQGFDGRIAKLGFHQTGEENGDVRWGNPQGIEVFLSQIPGQTVCSVWFDGVSSEADSELSDVLKKNGYANATDNDGFGVFWSVGHNEKLRLVVKQGSEQRIGAALFVQKD